MFNTHKIVVVTIHKGPVKFLKQTLKSVDSQILQPYLNLVVCSNFNRYLSLSFQKKNRVFLVNQDTSIYNAMNLSLKYVKNISSKVIFLNSGDIFYDNLVIKSISRLNFLKCLIGKVDLFNEWQNFTVKNYIFQKKNYCPHGGFVFHTILLKNLNNFIHFDENKKIDADGYWMKKIRKIARNHMIKKKLIISRHRLGGVSTYPNLKTLKYYLNQNKFLFVKEFFKFLLLILLKKKNYYKLIYKFKYDQK